MCEVGGRIIEILPTPMHTVDGRRLFRLWVMDTYAGEACVMASEGDPMPKLGDMAWWFSHAPNSFDPLFFGVAFRMSRGHLLKHGPSFTPPTCQFNGAEVR